MRRLLRAWVDQVIAVSRERLEAQTVVRQDALVDDVLAVFDLLGSIVTNTVRPESAVTGLREVSGEVNTGSQRELERQVKSLVGIDGVVGFVSEDTLNGWMREQARLFENVRDDIVRGLQQDVLAAVRDGTPTADLASIISKRRRIGMNRAKLIARDQVASLNGLITKERQESIGVTKFRWETSMDERVRDSHRALQGKVFDWNNPPSEGIPGQAINCRCTASAVFPELDED